MAKDVIIGVVDNYDWDKIKYWANSIKQSGFDGHKVIIAYNMKPDTVKKLTDEGFMTVGCNPYDPEKGFTYNVNGNIMVDRFFHIHNFLNMLGDPDDVDHVIVTDVRDVVFQYNPTTWLQTFLLHGYELLVGSENLLYKDEPWNVNNMKVAFGDYFFDVVKNRDIYCAGVIAGRLDAIKDLFLNLWLVCKGLNPHVPGGGGPDQAALNILLTNGVYSYMTRFTNPVDAWVCHAGTTWPAIQAGSGAIGQVYMQDKTFNVNDKYIIPAEFELSGNDVYVIDPRRDREKICVIHQWDRVPEWKERFEKRFGDN